MENQYHPVTQFYLPKKITRLANIWKYFKIFRRNVDLQKNHKQKSTHSLHLWPENEAKHANTSEQNHTVFTFLHYLRETKSKITYLRPSTQSAICCWRERVHMPAAIFARTLMPGIKLFLALSVRAPESTARRKS